MTQIDFLLSENVTAALGTATVYLAGTTTLATIYDSTGSTQDNPVDLTSKGTAGVWVDPGKYKVDVKDVDGASLTGFPRDNLGYGLQDGPWTDVTAYASLTAAIAAIGSTPTTLLIDGATSLTSNTTIPSTIRILTGINCQISLAGYTLSLADGCIDEVKPEYFAGSTPVTDAIQSAGNNPVKLGPKTYVVGSSSLHDGSTIIGAGIGLTVLKQNAADLAQIILGSNVVNVNLRGFTLETHASSSNATVNKGINISYSSLDADINANINIKEVEFKNLKGRNIHVQGDSSGGYYAQDIGVQDCVSRGCATHAFSFYYVDGLNTSNNRHYDNTGGDGIECSFVKNQTHENNKGWRVHEALIDVGGGCTDFTITGNNAFRCATSSEGAIKAQQGAKRGTISGNNVYGNGGTVKGISINYGSSGAATDIAITGNQIFDVTDSGIIVYGSGVDRIARVSVIGNTISAPDNHGLEMSVCEDCTIKGNIITAANGDGINLSDVRTSVVSGNRLNNTSDLDIASNCANLSIYGNNTTGTVSVPYNTLKPLEVGGQTFSTFAQYRSILHAPQGVDGLANDAVQVIGDGNSGVSGKWIVRNTSDDVIATFIVAKVGGNFAVTEISDPDSKFSTAANNASTTNLYIAAGSLTLQNKTGGTKSYHLSQIGL